jgi:hypothetical protein
VLSVTSIWITSKTLSLVLLWVHRMSCDNNDNSDNIYQDIPNWCYCFYQ